MKQMKFAFVMLITLGLLISGAALADRGRGGHHGSRAHIGLGFYFGSPYVPYYYPPPLYHPYPYYAYPPVIVAPQAPSVYIERGSQQEPAAQVAYWYYCDNPEGYYPYINECPGGWQKVLPQPQDR